MREVLIIRVAFQAILSMVCGVAMMGCGMSQVDVKVDESQTAVSDTAKAIAIEDGVIANELKLAATLRERFDRGEKLQEHEVGLLYSTGLVNLEVDDATAVRMGTLSLIANRVGVFHQPPPQAAAELEQIRRTLRDDELQMAAKVRKAAEHGYKRAQFTYAYLLFEGMGVEKSESESFKYVELASTSIPQAKAIAALWRYDGHGTTKDIAAAYPVLKEFVDNGWSNLAYYVAATLERGDIDKPDLDEAARYYYLGAKSGDSYAEERFVVLYSVKGIDQKKFPSDDMLRSFLERATKAGFAPAGPPLQKLRRSEMLLSEIDRPIVRKAREIDPSLEQEDAEYVFVLAHLQGIGLPRDEAAVVPVSSRFFEQNQDWYQLSQLMRWKGANVRNDFDDRIILGNIGDPFWLAERRNYTKPPPQFRFQKEDEDLSTDPKTRSVIQEEWQYDAALSNVDAIRELAEKGYLMAKASLGARMVLGWRLPRDEKAGAEYVRAAAEGGFAPAQALWAWQLAEGHGVDVDLNEAMRFWLLAADKQIPGACWCFADRYERGDSVEPDLQKAIGYYETAAKRGHYESLVALARIRNNQPVRSKYGY